MLARLKAWARRLKNDVVALAFAARDSRTPLFVRIYIALIVAYALSPIDLIPDVIPVLGYLDEALLLPAAIWLALRIVPADVLADGRRHAEAVAERPRSLAGAVIIVGIWLLVAWLGWRWARDAGWFGT